MNSTRVAGMPTIPGYKFELSKDAEGVWLHLEPVNDGFRLKRGLGGNLSENNIKRWADILIDDLKKVQLNALLDQGRVVIRQR